MIGATDLAAKLALIAENTLYVTRNMRMTNIFKEYLLNTITDHINYQLLNRTANYFKFEENNYLTNKIHFVHIKTLQQYHLDSPNSKAYKYDKIIYDEIEENEIKKFYKAKQKYFMFNPALNDDSWYVVPTNNSPNINKEMMERYKKMLDPEHYRLELMAGVVWPGITDNIDNECFWTHDLPDFLN